MPALCMSLLQDKPSARKVTELLKQAMNGQARVLMSAVNYGEAYGIILREYGRDRATTAMNAVNPLPIDVLNITLKEAIRAAEVKHKYKLYYADSFAAALALEQKATLVTSDSDFRKLGHGFPVLWLKA